VVEIFVLTKEEWEERARIRFGEVKNWKFICPSCGHIQSVEDMIRLKKRLEKEGKLDPKLGILSASSAYSNCIGRWIDGNKGETLDGNSPCNYSASGLIKLTNYIVINEFGEKVNVFDFAPKA